MLLFRVDRDYFTSLGDIIIEFFIKCVPGKGGSVSQDHQFHTGTGDGDVHAAQVAEETDPAFVVGAYEADHDHISLLPLEAIYCVDGLSDGGKV